MDPIPRVLQVGVGRWGQNHLRVWKKLDALGLCQLIGVLDSDKSRLESVREEFGIRTFSDEQAMFLADAVDVVVPTYDHFKVVKTALSIGKDVLVEKPMTKTLAEAEELHFIGQGQGQILMVGHLFMYNPALDCVVKMLRDGEIGKIRFLRGRFMGFRFKEHDAGVLATTAIHFIYVSNHLVGKFPQSVRAETSFLLDQALDDHATIRLNYGPEFGLIESDYFGPGKCRTFDIIGTRGAIILDLLQQKVELRREMHVEKGGRFETYDGGTFRPDIKFREPLDLELRHFLDCVRERKTPLTGVTQGVDVLRVIEAGYKSAQTDTTVELL